MKRINLFVMLFAIIGLSGGFMLVRDAKLLQSVESDPVQSRTSATNVEVAESASAAEERLRQEAKLDGGVDLTLTLVSSSGSVKPLAVDTTPAVGQEYQEHAVRISGLKAKTSNVLVAVFESEAGFPNSELSSKTTVVSATNDQVSFSLALPRNQPVAMAVFQDIDGNGKLSKNQIGIPTEPYGFSNNARGVFGPPSFSQAAFKTGDGKEQAETIEIKVR
jgi:uncharacterized protein (DUF2141 family)